MNSDDLEVASRGYRVKNDRPDRSEADRNDKTSCHASVLAGRSASASTCQTWSPWAITLHGIDHLAGIEPANMLLTSSPVNSCASAGECGGLNPLWSRAL